MRQAFVPKVLATVFASVWVLGVISSAQADTDKSERCSVATLKGSHGYTVTGGLVAGPSAEPFAAVGRLVFDGRGTFENNRTISRNGEILHDVEGSGTYIVNSNRTDAFIFADGGVGAGR